MIYKKHHTLMWIGIILFTMGYVSTARANSSVVMLTVSIISYTKWPNMAVPNLCVIDSDNTALALQAQVKQLGYNYKIQSITASQFNKSNCQAVFFVATPPLQQELMIHHYSAKDLLSLSNNNIDCEIGSIICFYKTNSTYSFKINLDALSQAKVHIDPRVLMLAKNLEANK